MSEQPVIPPDEPRPASRTLRMPLSNLQIILLLLIIIGGRLVIDFSQRIVEGQKKIAEQRQLEDEIAALREEQQQLEAAKAYYSSPSFVEAWAHSEGKMVREGERLVVPLYSDTEQTSAGQTGAVPQAGNTIPTWQVWWSLFFDNPPPRAIP